MHYYRPPQAVAYYPAPWSGNTQNSYEYQGYPYQRNNSQHPHNPSYSSGPSPYHSRNPVQQQPYYYIQPPHFPHQGQYIHGAQDPLPLQQMHPSRYQPSHQIQKDQYYYGGRQNVADNHLNIVEGVSTSGSYSKKVQQYSLEYSRHSQVQGEGLTTVNADDNFQQEIEDQCNSEMIQDSNSQRKISQKSDINMKINIDFNHEESEKSNQNSNESKNHKEKDNSSNNEKGDEYQNYDGCCRDNVQIKHQIEEINQSKEVQFREKFEENINKNTIFKYSQEIKQKVSAPENLKLPSKSEQTPQVLQSISKKTGPEKKSKHFNYLNENAITGTVFKAKYLSQQKTPLLHRRKIRSMKYLLDIQKQQQLLQIQQQNEEQKNTFFLESKVTYPKISVPCRKIPKNANQKVSQVFKGCFKHKYECFIQNGSGQFSSQAKQQNSLEEECCSLHTPSTFNLTNEHGSTLVSQREYYYPISQDAINRQIAICKIKTKKILKRKDQLTKQIENYKAMLEIKAIRQKLLGLSLSDFIWNFLRFLEVKMKDKQTYFNTIKIQLLQLESESPNIFVNYVIQNEEILPLFVSFLAAPLDKFIKNADHSKVLQKIFSFIQRTIQDISCEPISSITIESEENEQVISQGTA